MNLKHLISNSTYGTIGYVASQNDLDVLQSYLVYNNPVLKEFNKIVFAFNTEDNSELVTKVEQLCSMYYPSSVCLFSEINRGHNFGTADLDNMVFDYCKQNGVKWLCKSANDVILTEDVFDIEIEDADFYYMNGFSYETQYLNPLSSNFFLIKSFPDPPLPTKIILLSLNAITVSIFVLNKIGKED